MNLSNSKIIESIQKYFNPDNFETIFKDKNEYSIIDKQFISKHQCLHLFFWIDNSHMEVNWIQKCTISGNEILQRIDKIAKDLNIKKISLKDWSCIKILYDEKEYSFSLPILTILTNGQTWYNKNGYVSENFDIEIKNNSIKQQKKFRDFYVNMITDLYSWKRNEWNELIAELEFQLKLKKENYKLYDKILIYNLTDIQKKEYSKLNNEDLIYRFRIDKMNMINEEKEKSLQTIDLLSKYGYDIDESVKDIMQKFESFIRYSKEEHNHEHLLLISDILNICFNNIDFGILVKKEIK